MWDVEPEDPPPVGKLDYRTTVGRSQHGAGLRCACHDAQRQAPLLPRKGATSDRQPDGHGCAAAHGLYHPGYHHPFQALGNRYQAGTDNENHQCDLIDLGIAVHIGKAANHRHRSGVAQQIGSNDPGSLVELGEGNLQVQHQAWESSHHHRLIQGGNERAQSHNG